MQSYYGNLEKDAILQCYRVFNELQKICDSDVDRTEKITNVLFEHTKNTFEYVKKTHGKGEKRVLESSTDGTLQVRNSKLLFQVNSSKFAKIFEQAIRAEDKFFDQAAKEAGIEWDDKLNLKPGKILQKSLFELGRLLCQLEQDLKINKSKRNFHPISSNKSILSSQAIKTDQIAQKPFENYRSFTKNISDFLCSLSQYPYLTEGECQEVVSLLAAIADPAVILETLQYAKQKGASPETIDPLRLALIKGLGFVSEDQADILLRVLEKMAVPPSMNRHDSNSPITLKTLLMVFGDSFILNSGLEGDTSSRPYADLVSNYLASRNFKTPLAEQLEYILKNPIDLREIQETPKQLKKRIESVLKNCPQEPQRCLLFGGWTKHAIVYMIEQQKEEHYAFRVFNLGEGSEIHEQLFEKYQHKVAGCIGIETIPKERLFDSNFLACLQSLTGVGSTLGVKPQELLMYHFLPLLGGAKEKANPSVEHFLLQHRAGTCPYSNLNACISSMMPGDRFRIYEIDFKLFLLDHYYRPMLTAISQEPIRDNTTYQEHRLYFAATKRSLEVFAGEMETMHAEMSDEQIKKGEAGILLCRLELKKFDKNIFNYEKKLYSHHFESMTKCKPIELMPNRMEVKEEKKSGRVEHRTVRLHCETLEILEMIHQIPENPKASDFSDQIEQCLKKMACLPPEVREMEEFFLADYFFKRVGALDAWISIRFKDPSKAMISIDILAKKIAKGISKDRDDFRAERYLMFLSMAYVLERAFGQCPIGQRIIEMQNFSSLLAAFSLREHLHELCCSDPYWSSIRMEIIALKITDARPKEQLLPYLNLSRGCRAIMLTKQLQIDLCKWWFSPSNQELRLQAEESCKQDRIQQNLAIKSGAKSGTDNQILADQIKNESTYWPQGFEKNNGFLSNTRRATFLFAAQKQFYKAKLGKSDVLPPEFRMYCNIFLLSAHIFEKNDLSTPPPFDFTYTTSLFGNKIENLEVLNYPVCWSFSDSNIRQDTYVSCIKDEPLRTLYCENAFRKRTGESKLPALLSRQTHIKMEIDELKELYAIRCKKELQIDNLLSYFEEHMDKLAHHSWLNFFHSQLFELNLLAVQLKNPRTSELLLPRLQQFFQIGVVNAMQLGDYATAANLVWIASNVQRYAQAASKGPQADMIDRALVVELIEKSFAPKYEGQWGVISEAFLASWLLRIAPEANEIDKKLLNYTSLAHLVRNHHPLTEESICIARRDQADRGVLLFQSYVSKTPDTLDHHTLINSYGFLAAACPRFVPAHSLLAGHQRIMSAPFVRAHPPVKASLFSSFEDPDCTVYWVDKEENTQKIEFPRLNKSLKRESIQSKERWTLVEDKEWFLASDQFIPYFGQSTGFLVFQNDRGQKKAILPVWNPKRVENQALNFPYEYDFRAGEVKKGRCVEYSIVSNRLFPINFEARLYLAKIYLEKGRIDEAEELLFAHEAELTYRKHSQEENVQLMGLIEPLLSKEGIARTLRIRMHALYLYERNLSQFPDRDLSGGISQAAKEELIVHYLRRSGEIQPIPAREEYWILKQMVAVPQGLCPQLTMRFLELEHQERNDPSLRLSFPFPEPVVVSISTKIPSLNITPWSFEDNKINAPKPSLMDKIHYRNARADRTFPFNPYQVTYEEFKKFFPLLKKECEKTNGWKAARNSGLLPALYHMALFSIEPIQSIAQAWLNDFSAAEADLPYTSQTVEKPFTRQKKHYLAEGFHGLFLLKSSFDEPPAPQPPADFSDLNHLKAVLENNVVKESARLRHQESLILFSVASALTFNPTSNLQWIAKKRELPSTDELCTLCARKDFDKQAKLLYPELSPEGRKTLKEAATKLLIQKARVQQLERALEQMNELHCISSDPHTVQILQNTLKTTLEEKHCYNTLADPYANVFLMIETTLHIILRQEQVENIRKFAEGAEKLEPLVHQMIMGAGKTEVLQPTLAYLMTLIFSNSGTLSTVIIPEFLLEPIKRKLVHILGGAFHQFVFDIPYDRLLAKEIGFLRMYEEKLCEAIERGACLLMTHRQKHSILTSLYEAYYDLEKAPHDKHLQDRVDMIAKICNFMHWKEAAQLEEVDLIMDPQVIFTYPVGKKEPLKKERASILSELLIRAALDSTLTQAISLDFINAWKKRIDPGYIKQGVPLTEQLFQSLLQPRLVEIACELLSKRIPGFKNIYSQDPENYIPHFLMESTPYDAKIKSICLLSEATKIHEQLDMLDMSQLEAAAQNNSDQKRQLIAQKILYTLSKKQWIQTHFKIQEERELLGVCAIAIKEKGILSASLFKECGARYGVDPVQGHYIARPYEAPHAPKSTIYQDPYEQVVYSVQLAFYSGIPLDAARKMLLKLQSDAKAEMGQSSGILIHTSAYKRFVRLFGNSANRFQLLETPISDLFLECFQKAVSKDVDSLREFFWDHVFEQVAMYKQSLSSTPQTLAGSSRFHCGYSGRLQKGILARHVKAILEIGTDEKIFKALQNKIEKGEADIRVYSDTNGRTYPEQLIDRFVEDPNLFVYIDSGEWLKEENMDEYAEKLLISCENSETRKTIKGIVYHKEDGSIISLERDAKRQWIRIPLHESQFKTTEGKLLTLIAAKYETGTHILQKPTAKAIITIRKNMILDKALQSIFRMRQILNGQSVSFAFTEELKSHIASQLNEPTVSLNVLWGYFEFNQTAGNPQNNWIAGQHRMREVIEKPTRLTLCNLKVNLSHRLQLFRQISSFLVKDNEDSPFNQMMRGMRTVDAKTAIRHEVDAYLKVYQKLGQLDDVILTPFKKTFQTLYENEPIETILQGCVKEEDIGEVIRLGSCHTDNNNGLEALIEQEMEQEMEQEHLAQFEQEKEMSVIRIEKKLEEKPYFDLVTYHKGMMSYNLAEFFAPFDSSKYIFPLSDVMPANVQVPDDHRIFISQNLVIERHILGSEEHGQYHLPGCYILALSGPGEEKRSYILVSHEDAAPIKNGIFQSNLPNGCRAALFTLNGRLVGGNLQDQEFFNDEIHKRVLVQAKLLTGKVNLSNKEIQRLKKAILSRTNLAEDVLKLQRLYQNIIGYLPATAKRYHGSNIEKMFYQVAT